MTKSKSKAAAKTVQFESEQLCHLMFTHGTSLHVEYPDRLQSLVRKGAGATIKGKPQTTNWVHFAIPTPVYACDKQLSIRSVILDFKTGRHAEVEAVHVYNGGNQIAAHNGLSLQGDYAYAKFDVPGHKGVTAGVGVSVKVKFLLVPDDPDYTVLFRSAAAEFIFKHGLLLPGTALAGT